MTRAIAIATAALLTAAEAQAGPEELWDHLRLGELVEVMAEEGRLYGADLADQLFESGGGPSWDARVAGLYEPEDMVVEVKPLFIEIMRGVDTSGLEAFFSSELGQRIVGHELEARRAFLDPEVEAAATESVEMLREERPGRYALIREFVEVNELVDANVASSLTFTYAFNLGLVAGGLEEMSEDEALADAWSQEDAVRADTNRWLDAQLSLAFAPLTDDEVERYVEVSESDAGQALNSALFQAFEPTFRRIARELGEAVARSIEGEDI